MKLRTKLTIMLGTVIALGVFVSSFSIYLVAKSRLLESASQELTRDAALFSSQIKDRFNHLLLRVEAWSRSPYVQGVIAEPNNRRRVDRLNRAFLDVVESDAILQTFNLLDTKAACIASSIPSRIGLQEMQDVVSQKDDFQAALTGKSVIKGAFMAISSGRPIVSLCVPVWRDGKVKGVLRPIVDVDWFGRYCLENLWAGQAENVFVFSPELDLNQYAGHDFTLVMETPYEPPSIPPVIPGFEAGKGLVSYKRKGNDYLAAFHWMDKPRWLLVVEKPLNAILEPINTIKTAAWTIALGLFVLVWLVSGLAMRPILAGLRACMRMVRQVGDGDLTARSAVRSGDDIGKLAAGLNHMADHLQKQRDTLLQSERKYRGIFENAVEGIFQTREDGTVVAANPAMLEIVGAPSLEAFQKTDTRTLYAHPKQRRALLETLRKRGRVDQFEVTLRRIDGLTRQCRIHARAELDPEGRVSLIQGVLSDITAEHQAKEARQRARKAEKLFQEARFGTLRYQLNPHFIFNVLNTLDAMSGRSAESMSDFLQKISRYLREILAPRDKMLLPLGMELKAVKAYMDIEKVRFQDELIVSMEIDPETTEIAVPDMILQPLVENAVKYGMRTSPMPLKIIIKTAFHDDFLVVSVKNSGAWIDPETNSSPTQIGLANLKERLELVYGTDFSYFLHKSGGWVDVKIRLPIRPSA
jgi:PAS domain S-box-containing protein